MFQQNCVNKKVFLFIFVEKKRLPLYELWIIWEYYSLTMKKRQ